MLNKTAVYKEVLRDFDIRRAEERNSLEKRRQAVYKAVPRIKEIDEKIRLCGISTAQKLISEPETADEAAQKLKMQLETLKKEKNELLKLNNYPQDYLETHYKCLKCMDTGFVDSKPCSCFTQLLVDKAYTNSNIREITKNENFDTFDINFYSAEKTSEQTVSPRENMQRILAVCLDFTRTFGRKKENLFFCGRPGLGKTFLCSSIARELLDTGFTVLYLTAAEMFRRLEQERFSKKDEDETGNGFISDIVNVDLLIIDDLGTEFSTSFTSSELFDIINTRLITNKPVIISTNLEMAEIQEHYTDRIASRIIGGYRLLKFIGGDIRAEKRFRGI